MYSPVNLAGIPQNTSAVYRAVSIWKANNLHGNAGISHGGSGKGPRIHDFRHSHASLLISMGENPLLIKERLGHEKIQTTLGTYGHLYPNTNIEIAKKLTGVLSYQSASQSIANYTSNQHTAMYHKEI